MRCNCHCCSRKILRSHCQANLVTSGLDQSRQRVSDPYLQARASSAMTPRSRRYAIVADIGPVTLIQAECAALRWHHKLRQVPSMFFLLELCQFAKTLKTALTCWRKMVKCGSSQRSSSMAKRTSNDPNFCLPRWRPQRVRNHFRLLGLTPMDWCPQSPAETMEASTTRMR